LRYQNYTLRSSNTFVLKDKRLIKGPQLDARNRLISENPKRKKKGKNMRDSIEEHSPSRLTAPSDEEGNSPSKTDNLEERRT
jgi:hypothetical protein